MPIRNQSPLRDRVDLGAKNYLRNILMKQTYLINYSAIGGGVVEVKAHSRSAAEQLFWNTSDEEISKETDWSGDLQIDYMEIKDPYQVFNFFCGDYLDDEDKDGEEEEEEDENENEDEEGEESES